MAHLLQRLAASLDEKELSPETGISASDEYQYEWAIDTFLQYGKTLDVISQINTHGYNGMQCQLHPALHSCRQGSAPVHDFHTQHLHALDDVMIHSTGSLHDSVSS